MIFGIDFDGKIMVFVMDGVCWINVIGGMYMLKYECKEYDGYVLNNLVGICGGLVDWLILVGDIFCLKFCVFLMLDSGLYSFMGVMNFVSGIFLKCCMDGINIFGDDFIVFVYYMGDCCYYFVVFGMIVVFG